MHNLEKNYKCFIQKLLELILKFSKVAGYTINIKNYLHFHKLRRTTHYQQEKMKWPHYQTHTHTHTHTQNFRNNFNQESERSEYLKLQSIMK